MGWEREQIGNCTLYRADCQDILPLLSKVDVVVTDPPYGINLGQHAGAKERRTRLVVKSGGYPDSSDYFEAVVVPAVVEALEHAPRGMVFSMPPMMWKLPPPTAIGGVFMANACGRNRWGWSNLIHCLLYGSAPALQYGAKATAISSTVSAEVMEHPVPKPLPWMVWAVALGSALSGLVLDPFMGSGTTGVACVQLGRAFIGIEIESRYFDLACRRIEEASQQMDLFVPISSSANVQQKLAFA